MEDEKEYMYYYEKLKKLPGYTSQGNYLIELMEYLNVNCLYGITGPQIKEFYEKKRNELRQSGH